MAPLAPLREACLLFRPRRETLPFLRGMARAACCLAGVTGPLDALAQESPLRPALADAGLTGALAGVPFSREIRLAILTGVGVAIYFPALGLGLGLSGAAPAGVLGRVLRAARLAR